MSKNTNNIATKISQLTDAQIRQMAAEAGRPYLDIIKDLQAMAKQSTYWKSPAAKEAAKRYREKRKARQDALKVMFS